MRVTDSFKETNGIHCRAKQNVLINDHQTNISNVTMLMPKYSNMVWVLITVKASLRVVNTSKGSK